MRVDPYYITNLAGSLDQAQLTEQQLTAELSSGVRVTTLSTDPAAAGENVRLLNQIQQDDSFTQTTDLVQGQFQVADSALGSVVSQLTQAITLATSATNGTLNSGDQQSIANQIAGIRDEVQALANTSYQGQYIFAGGQTGTAPFSTSSGTSPATTTYNGDSDVTYLQTPDGQSIQLNVPGDQIFMGAGSNNVFTALNNLIADLSNSSNVGATAADTANLNSALNYLSSQRVVLDNSLTRLNAAGQAVTSSQTQLTAAQTDLMQADLPTISTQLSLAETQQTALEDVISQLGSNSLFSKLPIGG